MQPDQYANENPFQSIRSRPRIKFIFSNDSADEVSFKLSAVKSGIITLRFTLWSNFFEGKRSRFGVFLWVASVFHSLSFLGL